MSELGDLLERTADRVSLPPDEFERVAARRRRTQRRRRLFAAAVALAIAAAGVSIPMLALRGASPAGHPKPGPAAASPIDYSIQFGDVQPADQFGAYQILGRTNLPDGTRTMVDFKDANGGGGGTGPVVQAGVLDLTFVNNACTMEHGVLVSPSTTVTITVAWDYRAFRYGPAGVPESTPTAEQPPEVLAVLGHDFEDLQGPQVDVGPDGKNELVATTVYQLPADTCVENHPGPSGELIPLTPSP